MDLDLAGSRESTRRRKNRNGTLRFEVSPNSFFTVRLFNDALRAADPGTMDLLWGTPGSFPNR